MPVVLTEDMRNVIEVAHLCFAATVTPDGKPNLSPKGTIRLWDETHLFFCDIASPRTRANLEANAWIELNVVDQLSRRGYRFFGNATIHRGDDVYRRATAQIGREEGVDYPVEAVVLIEILRAETLTSPGYQYIASEWQMRDAWKSKRSRLDAEFETHLRSIATS